MLLRTQPLHPATVKPVPTAAKRVLRWWRTRDVEDSGVPALDVGYLRQRYGMANARAPRMKEATFTVPLEIQESTFAREQAHLVYRWIDALNKDGWDWQRHRGVQIYPGRYPAHDLYTGVALLDRREFIARAWFCHRDPQPLGLELSGPLLEPVQATGASLPATAA